MLTSGPNRCTNQAWAAVAGRLEDDVADVDRVDDLVDEPRPHVAGGPVDPGGAALATLGDHLPGAGVQVLPHPLDPLVGGVDDLRVLGADLGEDDEVAGQVGDQLELALAREVDRPVGDLDVGEAGWPRASSCTRRACSRATAASKSVPPQTTGVSNER